MSESFGAWQLESLVAVGGLGEVWRARRGDRVAALKRLHTHLARNEEGLRQFSVEQHLTTTLPHHRNLVHAFEAGDVEGRPYVALELIEGEDVRRLVAPPVPQKTAAPVHVVIPRSRAVGIVLAACDAASHLHAHGYVHGDICPGNLVVDAFGGQANEGSADRTVLVDLGVSRVIGEAGAVRGTHAYMAPEQVRAEPWTQATDVFAIGIVLWELLAGARLFHRGPPWLSMAAVVEADVPPLADAALDAIAQAALAKDPAARIQTAAELAQRLRAL
ncbi:MAG TPA: serine/threonine-protein kinase [Kofleriaceae bacterium]|nr:serine/threonine-protein kinase [Kofleriaceae bacterium]